MNTSDEINFLYSYILFIILDYPHFLWFVELISYQLLVKVKEWMVF